MQPARNPVVACAANGDLFCRECAISDLLAQRQEIKRLEREREDAKRRLEKEGEWAKEEAKAREVQEFELVSMGLEGSRKENGLKNDGRNNAEEDERNWGRKRRMAEEEENAQGGEEMDANKRRRKSSTMDNGGKGDKVGIIVEH